MKSTIITLLGAPGAGKTFLVNEVISKYNIFGIVKKLSTRAMRCGEENSIEILPECNEATVRNMDYVSCINSILKDPNVNLTYTGYSKESIDKILKDGKIPVVITNTENYKKLKLDYKNSKVIPIYIDRVYSSKEEYFKTMRKGGRMDSEIEVRYRVSQSAKQELYKKNKEDIGDNIIINNINTTVIELKKQFEEIAKKNDIDIFDNRHSSISPKIVLAIDSYKECMKSSDVEKFVERGINKIIKNASIIKIPIADGGEGTIDVLSNSTNGHIVNCIAENPYMELIDSRYGVLGDEETVVMELAATCSINMVTNSRKNPMNTTSYGAGTIIKNALDKGYKKFIIGLGGVCVCEGGIGALQSLGFIFRDKNGNKLPAGQGGRQLKEISSIDTSKIDKRLKNCEFIIARDVRNILCGLEGAAYTYAPQKGATPSMVQELDLGLENFANVIRKSTKIDIKNMIGAGAAGGFGAAFVALLGAKMISGAQLCLDICKFKEYMNQCDLVITGEGKIDKQTLYGKVPFSVSKLSNEFKVPVVAICGRVSVNENDIKKMGIKKVYEVTPSDMNLERAVKECSTNIRKTAIEIAKDFKKDYYRKD